MKLSVTGRWRGVLKKEGFLLLGVTCTSTVTELAQVIPAGRQLKN